MIDAVVFDLDGTLTDTEHVWDEVRRGLAQEDGVPWPKTATVDQMGMSTPEWSQYLIAKVGLRGTPEQAAIRTIDGMRAAYARGGLTIDGAAEAVRRIAAEYPVAIASSSPPILIDAACSALGIEDLIKIRVSTETVARGKPAPDGYLRACELLSVEPTRACAVEDATNGITSALTAGMACIAIPQAFHRAPDDLLARCDRVLDAISELTVAMVQRIRAAES